MRFVFTEEQEDIARSARDLLRARSPWEQVRAHSEGRTYDDALWREVSGLGWPGIAVSADHGGAGLGLVELIAIFEQLGYACAPLPHLGTAAAALLIEAAGSPEQQAAWLPRLASGESRGAVGIIEDGVSELVPDGVGADVVVLIDAAERRAFVVEDFAADTLETIDPTRSYVRVVASGGTALPGDVMAAFDRLLVAVSGELVGLGQRALELSVDYAKDRRQFGVPIGSFQAVQHRMAEMLLHIEGARSATYYAAWVSDARPAQLTSAAAIAKTTSSEAARYATRSAIQVHGGIGFTWEANVHWLFKRAHVDAAYLGTAPDHRARVADLLRAEWRQRIAESG
jgi:alkylation response protein AidB-like acyl-CoA dehydrogenase